MRLDHVEQLLIEWAAHCESEQSGGLAYPTRTAESRAGEGRAPGRPSSTVPHIVATRKTIKRVDQAVRTMPGDLRRAIRLIYQENLSQSKAAKRMHLSPWQFTDRIRGAKYWLHGRITK